MKKPCPECTETEELLEWLVEDLCDECYYEYNRESGELFDYADRE